jgi:hypothetical protein
LTELEEKAIVEYVLDLDSRSYPPRMSAVEDMANHLLQDRGQPCVSKNWTSDFIKQQPELRTRLSRRYNYQSAQCEDPDAIHAVFLVRNTIAKHGIQDADIYTLMRLGL